MTTAAVLPPFPRSPRQVLRRAMGAYLSRRWFMLNGPPDVNAICLTFDDGPHPVHTPKVLDALRELRIVATFFVVGQEAAKHPELVRRIAAEGHEIGHHSYSHSDPARTSALTLTREVRRTAALLADIAGIRPRLFRPPHGKVTPAKLLGSWMQGCTIVLWNIDPKDYAQADAASVTVNLRRAELKAGDLVLLHDNVPHTTATLPGLAQRAREQSLHFVTVSQWLA